MSGDAWNPAQYERFRAERAVPFFDLLALVRRAPGMRVVDLGCGTGELTRRLHDTVAARETLGLDTSEAMLAKARPRAGGGLRFEHGDIAAFAARGEYDLVFSNAALHWVPDHDSLFRRLADALVPGGQLAVQMPANFDHPAHAEAAAVAAEEPFRSALEGARHPEHVLAPERYATLLWALGFRAPHVRLQVYVHVLDGSADVVEWVRGTLLTSYERRLPPELFAGFVARYRERLLAALGDRRPFVFTFKRLLLWGDRAP